LELFGTVKAWALGWRTAFAPDVLTGRVPS